MYVVTAQALEAARTGEERRVLGITLSPIPAPALCSHRETHACASLRTLVLERSLPGARIDTVSFGRNVFFFYPPKTAEAVTFQCHLVS